MRAKSTIGALGVMFGLGMAALASPAWSGDEAKNAAGPDAALAAQARGIVSGFSKKLKGELMSAMKASGPVKAIEVCNTAAPAIAKDASTGGWTVGRTSLKLRNENNAPDAWEKETLQFFEAEKAKGADVSKLEKYITIEKDGVKTFRYMKAIPTAKPCLACHGGAVADPVKAKLDALYPKDQATGFKPGDIRGAFTLSKAVK
jgi:hypothetical protein